jgi:hypothetical protein
VDGEKLKILNLMKKILYPIIDGFKKGFINRENNKL